MKTVVEREVRIEALMREYRIDRVKAEMIVAVEEREIPGDVFDLSDPEQRRQYEETLADRE